jgi:Fe2+ or Zn2+ uptake regulation protein
MKSAAIESSLPMERPEAPQTNEQARREAGLAQAVLEMLAEQTRPVTLEMIAAWWLARQKNQFDARSVARAVEQLVAKGVLEEIGDRRPRLYRLKSGTERPSQPENLRPPEQS